MKAPSTESWGYALGRFIRQQKKLNLLIAIAVTGLIIGGGIRIIFPTKAADTVTTINDSVTGTGTNQWEYVGVNWQYYTDGGNKYQGDDHGSSAAGDYANFRFDGNQVKYYGAKSPQAGIIAVSIDGGTESMIDLYSATRQDNTLIYTSPSLNRAVHSLKIRLTGNKNASAIAAAAAVDRADVIISSTPPVLGDLNNDGTINIFDLSALLTKWGTTDAAADLNKDGIVSIFDLSVLLTNWGKTVTPAPTPPPPTPTPPPTPPPSGLPTKVMSIWHHRWEGPNLRDYPTDVKNAINLYVLGLAQGCGGGCMEYVPYNGQSVADHAADIRAIRARGIHVLMGFGGSGGTIQITNASQVTQAFNSIVGFVDTYGISGIDIDMEPSGSSWNEQSLNSLASQLKSKYGQGFIVGITPGLYAEHTERWLSLARLMGSNYDYMAPMLYDFPEAGDSRLTAVSVNKADVMAAGGVPQSKMIMGYMARPFSSYTNSTPTSALMLDAYRAVEAKYPNVRGFFIWEDHIMHHIRNWDFVRDSVSAGQP